MRARTGAAPSRATRTHGFVTSVVPALKSLVVAGAAGSEVLAAPLETDPDYIIIESGAGGGAVTSAKAPTRRATISRGSSEGSGSCAE